MQRTKAMQSFTFVNLLCLLRLFLFHGKNCWPSSYNDAMWGFSSTVLSDHVLTSKAIWLCDQLNLNVTFLPSPGHQGVCSDLLWQPVDACQPLFRSVPWFDGWTLRQVVLHSEHTHIVFVPETFPLPDRKPREPGYDPHGNVTHGDIRPDRTMMWDNVTWNALLPL